MNPANQNRYLRHLDLVIRDEVDSTNDEMRRMLLAEVPLTAADAPSAVCKAVLAFKQSRGRGRLGRNWSSPSGGAYFSLAWSLPGAANGQAALSLVCALGLRQTLAKLVGEDVSQSSSIKVKWPNDIICKQGKLAGILIESINAPVLGQTAIIGVGINISRPAQEAISTAAYLSDLSALPLDLRELALRAIDNVVFYCGQWQDNGYGFAAFQDEYNSHLALLGQAVTIKDANARQLAQGQALGVDANGNLLVSEPSGNLAKVNAGEVTLRQ